MTSRPVWKGMVVLAVLIGVLGVRIGYAIGHELHDFGLVITVAIWGAAIGIWALIYGIGGDR